MNVGKGGQSTGKPDIVHDLDGRATHHHRRSLAYPTRLDRKAHKFPSSTS